MTFQPIISNTDSDPRWHILLTAPQREHTVSDRLKDDYGIWSFFPTESAWITRRLRNQKPPPSARLLSDGRHMWKTRKILTPRMLFVHFSSEPRWHILERMPYVQGVLAERGKPVRLSERDRKLLLQMRRRENQISYGDHAKRKAICFAPGETVEVTDIAALEGLVCEITAIDGAREVAFLGGLEMLGKPVEVPFGNLSKIGG